MSEGDFPREDSMSEEPLDTKGTTQTPTNNPFVEPPQPTGPEGDPEKGKFVQSIKPGAVDLGVRVCTQEVLDEVGRAKLITVFFLDSLNHFHLKQERFLIITKDSLIRVHYNFQTKKVAKKTLIPFQEIRKIQRGPIRVTTDFKKNEVTKLEGQKAVQVFTKLDKLSNSQKFNPKSKSIPFSTYLCHEPTRLYGVQDERHSLDLFYEKLCEAVGHFDKLMETQTPDKFVEEEIHIHGGLGFANYMYNAFNSGRSMDRKGKFKEDTEHIGQRMRSGSQAVMTKVKKK